MLPLKDDTPTLRPPLATWTLILITVAVYFWQTRLGIEEGQRVTFALGTIPSVILGENHLAPGLAILPESWGWMTLLTAMFLHGSWTHLAGNMLYLFIFGNNVEDAMGPWRFIAFYLVAGLIAAGGQIIAFPQSTTPMIGASGAVAGVLGAYLLLYPRARVLVWFFWILIFQVPAMLVLGLWFALQFWNAFTGGEGVAWWAHIAGFIAGMALILVFRRPGVGLFAPARPRPARRAPVRRGPWER